MTKKHIKSCHPEFVSGSCRSMKGFTLIELLVVVLIIGILAAVALPQYNKAVEKTRIAAALPIMDSIKKSMDVWLLENGYPASGINALFVWPDHFTETSSQRKAEAAIDVRALDCSGSGPCTDGTFLYEAACSTTRCDVDAYRSWAAFNGEGDYDITMKLLSSTNQWEYTCYYYDASGQRACHTLQSQGNWQIIDGNE